MTYGHNYRQEIDPDYFAMSIDRRPIIERVKGLVHGERFSRLHRPIKRVTDRIPFSLHAIVDYEPRL